MTNQCCKLIFGGRFGSYQCTRKGKSEREGKHYCAQHDPVAVAAKNEANIKKWRAEWDQKAKEDAERQKREDAIEQLCGHIPTDELANYELVKRTT